MADAVQKLQKRLEVEFKDLTLLRQALVHRSYLNENRDFELAHNERLEFLGDAVLELIVTDHLYRTYEEPEGELTSWRSALVRGEHLAVVARELDLGSALLMSRGEEKSGGRDREALLANAFEAVIGALYVDQGYEPAKEMVHRLLMPRLPKIIEQNLHRDAKSRLQEIVQEQHGVTPNYQVMASTGPDHEKRFTVGAFVGKKKISEGQGTSKQSAEQDAAQAALTGWPEAKQKAG